jgi:hypothetical protein
MELRGFILYWRLLNFWIILVNNQHDAHFFSVYVYFDTLHVSSNHVLIIRRINFINEHDDEHMVARNMWCIEINIYWKELCVKLVIHKNYTQMHGQQNVKFNVWTLSLAECSKYIKIRFWINALRIVLSDSPIYVSRCLPTFWAKDVNRSSFCNTVLGAGRGESVQWLR